MMKDRTQSQFQSVGELLPGIVQEAPLDGLLFGEEVQREDIGYTHPVFLQCFLPTRHTAKNKQRWQTDCGRASLVIRAGELVKPNQVNTFETRVVPAGPKARYVVAYVNDYIQREKTRTVDMGRSLRQAMNKLQIPINGTNGKALENEVKNFAAAEITLGVWDQDGNAHQTGGKVAKRLSFWIDKDDEQRTLWQPELDVSQDYYDAVRDGDRMAPFYWPAMIALSDDVRAMDIHCFLVYRLRQGLRHDVPISARQLHALFGQDVQQLDHFWPRFVESLKRALKWYPEAHIAIKNDCIILKNSRPLIPHRKVARIR